MRSNFICLVVAAAVLASACGGGDGSDVPVETGPTHAITTEPPTTTTAEASPPVPSTVATSSSTTSTATVPPSTIPETDRTERLAGAVAAAFESECMAGTGATMRIVGEAGQDLQADRIGGVITTAAGDSELVTVSTSLMFQGVPYTFSDDDAVALAHAKLLMNHMRSYVDLGALIHRPGETWLARATLAEDGTTDASSDPWADDLAYAVWPSNEEYGYGEQLFVRANGEFAPTPFHYDSLIRHRDPGLVVGPSDLDRAWEEVDATMAPVKDIADAWDLQAVPGLEPLLADIDELEALLCVIVATEWQQAQDVIEDQGEDWVAENSQVLYDYVAAQEALLALEYVRVVAAHMQEPEVDWLRAPDVDESSNQFDGVTSTFEYVSVWIDGARKTLESCDLLREQTATVDEVIELAAEVPGDTIADATLQRDVLELIMLYESALAPECADPTITNTELLNREWDEDAGPMDSADDVSERWSVNRCGLTVTYTVTYQQADDGGINFSVHLDQPDES